MYGFTVFCTDPQSAQSFISDQPKLATGARVNHDKKGMWGAAMYSVSRRLSSPDMVLQPESFPIHHMFWMEKEEVVESASWESHCAAQTWRCCPIPGALAYNIWWLIANQSTYREKSPPSSALQSATQLRQMSSKKLMTCEPWSNMNHCFLFPTHPWVITISLISAWSKLCPFTDSLAKSYFGKYGQYLS